MKPSRNIEYNRSLQLTLFLLALLLPLFIGGVAWFLSRVTPEDIKAYHTLMDKVEQRKTVEKPHAQSYQEREQVRKEVWFNQKGERLHLRILAPQSTLALQSKGEGSQMVEHMQEVVCLMQEELYYVLPNGQEAILQTNGQLLIRNADLQEASSWVSKETPGIKPMQLVRYMKAKKATYFYKTERFVGHDVHISTYAMPGHQLKQEMRFPKPLMHGIAEKVEFSLLGNELNFKAYQMKVSFFANTKL